MPHSQYVATRFPPSLIDRLLMGHLSIPLACVSVLVGVQIVIALFQDFHVSRGLSESSIWVQTATAILLFVGGTLTLWGTFNPSCKLDKLKAMIVRRAGTTGLAAGWWTFALAVTFTGNSLGVIAAELGYALGAGFTLYSVGTWLRERQVEQALEVEGAENGA